MSCDGWSSVFGEKQKNPTLGLNIYKNIKLKETEKPQLEAGDPTHSVIPSDNQLVRDSQPSEVIYFSISDGFWIITISLPRGSIGNYSKSCLGLSTCLLTIINMQGAQGRSQGKNTEMKPLLSPPLLSTPRCSWQPTWKLDQDFRFMLTSPRIWDVGCQDSV